MQLPPPRNLYTQVVHYLGQLILSGKVKPGEALPKEWTLCDQLGVSRTVVREAIKSLAAKGLVESKAKLGTIVQPIENWNLLDPDVLAWQTQADQKGQFLLHLTEFRQIVEPAAAALTASRATSEQLAAIREAFRQMCDNTEQVDQFLVADARFHLEILNAAGNPLLGPAAHAIKLGLEHSLRVTNQQPQENREALPLHEKVLQALEDRAPERARSAMVELLEDALRRIKAAV